MGDAWKPSTVLKSTNKRVFLLKALDCFYLNFTLLFWFIFSEFSLRFFESIQLEIVLVWQNSKYQEKNFVCLLTTNMEYVTHAVDKNVSWKEVKWKRNYFRAGLCETYLTSTWIFVYVRADARIFIFFHFLVCRAWDAGDTLTALSVYILRFLWKSVFGLAIVRCCLCEELILSHIKIENNNKRNRREKSWEECECELCMFLTFSNVSVIS